MMAKHLFENTRLDSIALGQSIGHETNDEERKRADETALNLFNEVTPRETNLPNLTLPNLPNLT